MYRGRNRPSTHGLTKAAFLSYPLPITKELSDLTQGFGHNLTLIPASLVQDETWGLIEEHGQDMQQALYGECGEAHLPHTVRMRAFEVM
jgi:hypothetical protein